MIKYNNKLYTPFLLNEEKHLVFEDPRSVGFFTRICDIVDDNYKIDLGIDSYTFNQAANVAYSTCFHIDFFRLISEFRRHSIKVETESLRLLYSNGIVTNMRDKKTLIVFSIPIEELNILYDLYKFYTVCVSISQYPTFREFLDFIEYKGSKFTIFVKKEFIKGNNDYKTARKRFKEKFSDEEKYEQIIVEDLDSLIVNIHYKPYKFKTNNLFEREDKKKQEINNLKDRIKNDLDILIDDNYERKLFQRKTNKLFPYERIFDELKPSTLLLGEDG